MAVSKKTRFEVFKRDKFTCQYCGRAAPDIVLNLEHVKPRATGGDDDILNLVTSCFDCNAGKGARELSDDSVIKKRKSQLDQLQERREQLDMLMDWQSGLADMEADTIDAIANLWGTLVSGYTLNEGGRQAIRKWLHQFDVNEICGAMRAAAAGYVVIEDGTPSVESIEAAFSKISAICNTKRRSKEQPYLKEVYYIRKIARQELNHVHENEIVPLLCGAFEAGVSFEDLKHLARTARSCGRFNEGVRELIKKATN